MSLFLQMLVLRGVCPILGTQYPQEFAMSKTAITSPELAPPVGPFSQAVKSMVSFSSADRSPKTRLQSALSCPHDDRGCRATTRVCVEIDLVVKA